MKKQMGFVAIADVMGFKKLHEKKDVLDLAKDYREFLAEAGGLCRKSSWKSRTEEFLERPTAMKMNGFREWITQLDFGFQYQVFSDTILLWWIVDPITHAQDYERKSDNFAMKLLVTVPILIIQGLVRDFPLRIGVAYGECVIEPKENIYLGQAIVDAYETEHAQDWMGVAYHPSCLKFFEEHSKGSPFPGEGLYLCKYPIPVKPAKDPPNQQKQLEWTANWPGLVLMNAEMMDTGLERVMNCRERIG